MAKVKANISIDLSADNGNLTQRLDQLEETIAELKNHKQAMEQMGFALSVSESSGQIVVTIQDK